MLIVFGRIKFRVRSSYVHLTVLGTAISIILDFTSAGSWDDNRLSDDRTVWYFSFLLQNNALIKLLSSYWLDIIYYKSFQLRRIKRNHEWNNNLPPLREGNIWWQTLMT